MKFKQFLNKLHKKNSLVGGGILLLILLPLLLFSISTSNILNSHAASATSNEAESGILSGNATTQNDPTASGGKYVLLNTAESSAESTTTPAPSSAQNPSTGDIQINFTAPIQTIDKIAFGMDESGYPGGNSPVLATDTTEQQRFKSLGVGLIRVALAYTTPHDPSSKIICSGSGCNINPTGDQWINIVKSMGAEPIVIVPIDPIDAANLVKHFNKDSNNYIKRWIYGNEPTIPATDYANSFNSAYDAMKSVDTTILVGGPGSPDFACCTTSGNYTPSINTFMNISGSRTDFVDFHKYGQGGSINKTDSALLGMTTEYASNITTLKAFLKQKQPTRNIGIEVGEWQLDWDHIDPRFETQFNTVWVASALGNILKSGAIALPYATKNLDLGFVTEGSYQISGQPVNTPMPAYHGYGMFTGEGLFRGFAGAMVNATTTLPNIEVFASNNKNVVVINKDATATQNAIIGLAGYSHGIAEVWRKDVTMNAFTAPVKVGTVNVINGSFTYTLPPYSVTTFVLQ